MLSKQLSPVSSRTDTSTPVENSMVAVNDDTDTPIFFDPYQDAIAQADHFKLILEHFKDSLEPQKHLDVYFQLYQFLYETDIFGYTLDELINLGRTSIHEKTKKVVTAFITKFQAQFFRDYKEFCTNLAFNNSLVSIKRLKELKTFLKDHMSEHYAKQLSLSVPDFDLYSYPENLTKKPKDPSKHYLETVNKIPRTCCLVLSKVNNKKDVEIVSKTIIDMILAGKKITSETSFELYDKTLTDPEKEEKPGPKWILLQK